jgi:hypothetical protein
MYTIDTFVVKGIKETNPFFCFFPLFFVLAAVVFDHGGLEGLELANESFIGLTSGSVLLEESECLSV